MYSQVIIYITTFEVKSWNALGYQRWVSPTNF